MRRRAASPPSALPAVAERLPARTPEELREGTRDTRERSFALRAEARERRRVVEVNKTRLVSVMPGDLVKLHAPVEPYPTGVTARVVSIIEPGECVVEFDDGRQLEVAVAALGLEPWAGLGMGQT